MTKMTTEEFGAVFNDFLLWLEVKKEIKKASFRTILVEDYQEEIFNNLVGEYFQEAMIYYINHETKKLSKLLGYKIDFGEEI